MANNRRDRRAAASREKVPALLHETSPEDAAILGAAEEGLRRIQQADSLDEPVVLTDEEVSQIEEAGQIGHAEPPPAVPTAESLSAEVRVETARKVISAFHEMADLVGGLLSGQETGETFENITRMPEFPIHVRGLVPEPQPRMPQERLDLRIRIPAKWQKVCPKRPGTDAYLNWKCYVDGMTLGAYLAHPNIIGGRRRARRDVAWDVEHGFVELQDPHVWAEEQGSQASETAAEVLGHDTDASEED